MKNKIKTICFDIDQIICVTKKNFYNFSKPKKKTKTNTSTGKQKN